MAMPVYHDPDAARPWAVLGDLCTPVCRFARHRSGRIRWSDWPHLRAQRPTNRLFTRTWLSRSSMRRTGSSPTLAHEVADAQPAHTIGDPRIWSLPGMVWSRSSKEV